MGIVRILLVGGRTDTVRGYARRYRQRRHQHPSHLFSPEGEVSVRVRDPGIPVTPPCIRKGCLDSYRRNRDDLLCVSWNGVFTFESSCPFLHETKGNGVPSPWRNHPTWERRESSSWGTLDPVPVRRRRDPGQSGHTDSVRVDHDPLQTPSRPLHLCVPDSNGPVFCQSVTHTSFIPWTMVSNPGPCPTHWHTFNHQTTLQEFFNGLVVGMITNPSTFVSSGDFKPLVVRRRSHFPRFL